MTKPFSQACENNKQPILDVLTQYITEPGMLVEVGSGTGQHAIHMAQHLPHVLWQPTDMAENLPGIEAWRAESQLPNVAPALSFDVWDSALPVVPAHYLYSANTLHIMSWETVQRFFSLIPQLLERDGYAFFYGPFNYNGEFTSPSNAQFDQWLKQRAQHQGIRDFEAISDLAAEAGLSLVQDHPMPANNRTLVWRRSAG